VKLKIVLQNLPNIVCSGQVRALPTLSGIQPRGRIRFLGFIRQFPHLPLGVWLALIGKSLKSKPE
jgi:hypothetical protein